MPGFFQEVVKRNDSSLSLTNDKRSFIDMGGHGFLAIAIALIDFFDRNAALMRLHQKPPCFLNDLIIPEHCLHDLITGKLGEVFIQSLVKTLGRMAFDELCCHPLHYRGVFTKQAPATTVELMQTLMTKPNNDCLAALAEALQLTIELQVMEHGKAVYASEHYAHAVVEGKKPLMHVNITLRRYQENYYLPLVQSTHWQKLSYLSTLPLFIGNENTGVTYPTLNAIQTFIQAADESLVKRFNQLCAQFSTMALEKRLTKADWFAIYVRGLSEHDASLGKKYLLGTEHGTQDYLDNMLAKPARGSAVGFPPSYDDEVINSCMCAIARAICLGKMPADIVDAYIDTQQIRQMGLRTL